MIPIARHASTAELGEHGRKCVPARVVGRGRERLLERLHDDGDPPAPWHELRDRLTGERVAERLDDRRADVGDRVERRRRGE